MVSEVKAFCFATGDRFLTVLTAAGRIDCYETNTGTLVYSQQLIQNMTYMTRIAAWMTGEEEILHFRVFTWTNVKGGGISLLIGALVYLFVVRRVLMREGSYVNLWPKWLDLEDLVYRPLLTGILPGFFGRIVAVFGENRVLKPLAAAVPKAAGAAASVPGENKLLAPFAKLIMFLGTFFGRVLSMSTDALIMLLRKTVVRERRVRRAEDSGTVHTLTAMREATAEALSPLTENFSFALIILPRFLTIDCLLTATHHPSL